MTTRKASLIAMPAGKHEPADATAVPAAAELDLPRDQAPHEGKAFEVMSWMAERVVGPDLSDRDIEALSSTAAEAQRIAQRAARVAEGLAFMVDADANYPETGRQCGRFRDGTDVPELLQHFGDVFSLVAGLINVSEWADAQLLERSRGRR